MYRALRSLTQDQLAAAMRHLGHQWHRVTVTEVERGGRTSDPDLPDPPPPTRPGRAVDTDELVGLALALKTTIGDLLDPGGPDGLKRRGFLVGSAPDAPREIPQAEAHAVARSTKVIWLEERPTLFPDVPDYVIQRQDRRRSRSSTRDAGESGDSAALADFQSEE